MWVIIICGAVGFLIGLLDDCDRAIAALLGAFVGLVAGFLLAMFIGLISYDKIDFHERVVLQNIQDSALSHGEFFLGSGVIDDVPTYSFYVKTGKNTYRRRDIDAYYADIHYTSGIPNYVKHWQEAEKEVFKPWYINAGGGNELNEHYDFYIPRGSITSEYKLDAK